MTDQEIDAVYHGFEKKDISLPEFRKRIKAVLDPNRAMQDLENIRISKSVTGVPTTIMPGRSRRL